MHYLFIVSGDVGCIFQLDMEDVSLQHGAIGLYVIAVRPTSSVCVLNFKNLRLNCESSSPVTVSLSVCTFRSKWLPLFLWRRSLSGQFTKRRVEAKTHRKSVNVQD